jgi:hypothetical protein
VEAVEAVEAVVIGVIRQAEEAEVALNVEIHSVAVVEVEDLVAHELVQDPGYGLGPALVASDQRTDVVPYSGLVLVAGRDIDLVPYYGLGSG